MQATHRLYLVGFSSASSFILGIGIVLPAWIAFRAGGSSPVGLVLLTSSVAGVVPAPLSGYIVDRYRRLAVTATGQTIRACGLFALAFEQVVPEDFAPLLLVLSAALGAFGYALLAGAMSGLLQSIVPTAERMAFNIRLSFFNQAGLALGTGAAGYAIDRLGSASTAGLSACLALAILPLLVGLAGTESYRRSTRGLTPLSASREAFRYLLNEPQNLSAAVTVGLAFAVIQITNLLLPGFVIHSLGGGSDLFGVLEMAAAIAGMVALVVASIPALARRLARATAAVLAGAAASLVALSFVITPLVAIPVYAIAGVLWSLSRAAANGHLLTLVHSALIGRVQAFATLLTARARCADLSPSDAVSRRN